MAIYLFTDFGVNDFYVGQMKSVLQRHAPAVPVIDLLHHTPSYNIQAGAHLLAALDRHLLSGSVVLGVVDPGVGSSREAVLVVADGKSYIGPDNGLFSIVAARAHDVQIQRILWRPETVSNSFHGRDIFAPVAAWIAANTIASDVLEPLGHLAVRIEDVDLRQIIYVDHYGNAISGIRARNLDHKRRFSCRGVDIAYARTFPDAQDGGAFWYENSLGLVEIALNCGNAAQTFGFSVGDGVAIKG